MKLKKLLLPGMLAVFALSLAACADDTGNEKDGKETNDKQEETVKDEVVTYTDPSKILEKFESDETFAFVIGNANCGACQMFKAEGLKKLSTDEGVLLPFIETLDLEKDKKENDAFVKVIDEHLKGQFEATPTTYFVVKGELKETIVGVMPYELLVENLDKHVGLENLKPEVQGPPEAPKAEDAVEGEETDTDIAEVEVEDKK